VVGRNGMVRGTVSVAFEDFLGNPLEEDFLVLSFVVFLTKLRFKLFDVRHLSLVLADKVRPLRVAS
jgi:hypothetical protein